MTNPKSSTACANSQAEDGPSAGPQIPKLVALPRHDGDFPPSDPGAYGPQWALCVSTSRALGLAAGIFVRQLAHWLVEVKTGGTSRDGRRWIWRTYEEWAEEFGWWNPQAIKRTIIPSIPNGVLLKKRIRDKGLLYSLDFERIAELIKEVGEPLPKWLIDAIYDPPLPPGVQARFVEDPNSVLPTNDQADVSINKDRVLVQVNSDLNEIREETQGSSGAGLNNVELLVQVTIDPNEEVGSDPSVQVNSDPNLPYKANIQNKPSNPQLASSTMGKPSVSDDRWDKLGSVAPDPWSFFERVWSLYCDRYDDDETIGMGERRWQPLREAIVDWQRRHEAYVDPSRAQQVFDSITTRNPREPIGLIYSVFRDEMSVRHDLNQPYEPPKRAGPRRIEGRY